jgi:hypothetical protein
VGINGHAILKDAVGAGAEDDLKEIVMGLHWHPQEECAVAGKDLANLDALCVLSDRITEREWIRLDLTTLEPCLAHSVATLRRSPTGWRISPEAQAVHGDIARLGQEYRWLLDSRKTSVTTTKGGGS